MVDVRMHAGLQYSYLSNSRNAVSTTAAAPTDYTSYNSSRHYWGVGPRMGIEPSYGWGNGLSFYGKGAVSLLVGDAKFSGNDTTVAGVYNTASGSSTIIVPEVDAKLGGMYTYAMAQGDLSLDIGWMFVDYINAYTLVL